MYALVINCIKTQRYSKIKIKPNFNLNFPLKKKLYTHHEHLLTNPPRPYSTHPLQPPLPAIELVPIRFPPPGPLPIHLTITTKPPPIGS